MQSSPGSEGGTGRTVADDAPAHEPERDLLVELAAMEDRFKRALADLDNYRKRAARELERRADEIRDSVLRDWLDPVDSVERALRMGPDHPCYEGMRAVLDQMEATLARHGVQRIGAPGERFDPRLHEAVGVVHVPDLPDRTIVDVARSGYVRGDRVLRPAQVIVTRTPETAA
jgi:molecular chaperone GrpE